IDDHGGASRRQRRCRDSGADDGTRHHAGGHGTAYTHVVVAASAVDVDVLIDVDGGGVNRGGVDVRVSIDVRGVDAGAVYAGAPVHAGGVDAGAVHAGAPAHAGAVHAAAPTHAGAVDAGMRCPAGRIGQRAVSRHKHERSHCRNDEPAAGTVGAHVHVGPLHLVAAALWPAKMIL